MIQFSKLSIGECFQFPQLPSSDNHDEEIENTADDEKRILICVKLTDNSWSTLAFIGAGSKNLLYRFILINSIYVLKPANLTVCKVDLPIIINVNSLLPQHTEQMKAWVKDK